MVTECVSWAVKVSKFFDISYTDSLFFIMKEKFIILLGSFSFHSSNPPQEQRMCSSEM
jgi:hypothetical protein